MHRTACPFCYRRQDRPTGDSCRCIGCGRSFVPVALAEAPRRGSTTRLLLGASTSTPADAPTVDLVGDGADGDLVLGKGRYRCEDELGRGGMGVVMQAQDLALGRPVAVKILREPGRAGRMRRFLREAQISGQLEHPNIVPVHDFGSDGDERVFFTMKRIEGRTLADHLDQLRTGRPGVSLERLVDILTQVCHGVEFAHSRGVIHRDLKPSNIMLGGYGEVLVMDWGLARQLADGRQSLDETPSDHDLDDGLTREGNVMGTPAYMAPEQAEGRIQALTARADQYALGAILFELLTLRPPVRGGNLHETLAEVRAGRIPDPAQVAPEGRSVPRDLAAVALKALALDPESRYPDVAALRKDLEAWRDGRTVSARAANLAEVLLLVTRRHRAATIVGGVAGLLLLGLGSGAVIINHRLRVQAEDQAAAAESARALADDAHARASRALAAEQEARAGAERERHRSSLALAGQEIAVGDTAQAARSLAGCPAHLRDWPWRRLSLLTALDLNRRSDAPDGIGAMALDGTHLWAAGLDGRIHGYGEALVPDGLAWTAHKSAILTIAARDGRLMTGGADGTIRRWVPGQAEPDLRLIPACGAVRSLCWTDAHEAWSLHGRGTLIRWNLETGAELLRRILDPACELIAGPSGPVIATPDGITTLDGTPIPLPGGWTILAGHTQGWLGVRRLDGRSEVALVGSQVRILARLPGQLRRAVWSAAGDRVAVASEHGLVWSLALDGTIIPLPGHAGPVSGLAFLPDGSLATAGEEGSVRRWDPLRRRDHHLLPGVSAAGLAVAAADGPLLALAGTDGQLALLDARAGAEVRRMTIGTGAVALTLGAETGLVAVATRDGRCRIFRTETGDLVAALPGITDPITHLTLSTDGTRIAVAVASGRIRIFLVAEGRELFTCHGHSGRVTGIHLGSERIISAGLDGTVRMFSSRNGERLATSGTGAAPADALALLPDGGPALVAHGRTIVVTDPADGRRIRQVGPLPAPVKALVPDGPRWFVLTADGALRCLDADAGLTLLAIPDLPDGAIAMAGIGLPAPLVALADGRVAVLPSASP